MLELISFLSLALILGFKHSYDADHIIAVSNILRKVESIKSAIKVGFSWAIGHMLTVTIITILLYTFKEHLLNGVLPHFEKIVGIMLVALGVISLKDAFFHNKNQHIHKHILGIGIIHGLASSDELLMLFTAYLGITTLGGILLGMGFFSLGVVIGMILFSFIFTYPIIKLHSNRIYRIFSLLTGAVSLSYGTSMIFEFI